MALVVEDGTMVAGANSYVSESDLTAYATARGITITGDEEELLIRAMDYIETLSYQGVKRTQDQALQWPRYDVIIDSYYLDNDVIPSQLKNGLMETALAIDAGNDPQADVARQKQSVKVGDLAVTYESGQASSTVVVKINNALAKLLVGGNSGSSFAVDRG